MIDTDWENLSIIFTTYHAFGFTFIPVFTECKRLQKEHFFTENDEINSKDGMMKLLERWKKAMEEYGKTSCSITFKI